ncbi:MAG: TonB-dependent siderophore receptor, partial [Methylocystis sp.]
AAAPVAHPRPAPIVAAQPAPSPAQDPYNKSYVLQNASTGTKTNTPVMDTPLNVQSVSQKVLQDQQATTLSTALQNVSGISVTDGTFNLQGTGSSGILLRGFLTNTYYRDGFRVDATYAPFESTSNRQLANVQNIDVLKGPGAILYGLIDPGGILNLTTKEPLDAPYYAVQQQVGSLAFYRTTVDATGPLNTDKSLLYRINMSYENNGAPFGSFVDFTHSQSLFVAPVLKWNVDEATWVKLEGEYNHYNSTQYFPLDPLANGVFVNLPRSTNYGAAAPYLQSDLFSALTWSHQFDKDWSIKQQIAYYYYSAYANNEAPFFPTFIGNNIPAVFNGSSHFQTEQTTYSTNVDITGHLGTFGLEHTVLLGGDVYWTTGSETIANNGTQFNSLFDPINLGLPITACAPFSCTPVTANEYTQNTAGLYLQDQVKLPYNFSLLAGARYQYLRQTNGTGVGQYDLQPTPTLAAQALTPRFGLLWRPQEWLSLYGNYTEGFGPNQAAFLYPGELAPPTSAKSWEAGAKLELFGGKLRATADYFELVKTNVPTPDTNPAHVCAGGGGGANSCSVIVGEARSTGPELDVQGEILPGWNVIATYSNDDVRATKAAVNEIPALGGTLPAVGQRFPGVPRNQASLWNTYEFQNDSVLRGVKIGAGYHYTGSRPIFDVSNYAPYVWPLIPSYGTVDLMAAYSFSYAGSKITAQLNVTNLLNRTYYGSEYNDFALAAGPAGGSFRSYGAPFAVLGSLRAELDKGTKPPPWLLPVPTATPSTPSFAWTGFYFGGQMGYGWGLNDGSVSWATADGQVNQAGLNSGAQGVIGGGHVGYNQQFDRMVLGLEGSVDGTTLTKHVLVPGPNYVADPTQVLPIGATVTGNVQSGVQGSVRARAGYTFGRLLPYATGGVAIGSFKSDAQLFGVDVDGMSSLAAGGAHTATRVGWTLGAGLEYAVNNHWSMRAEYRYTDFGHLGIMTDPSAVGAVFTVDRHLDQQQLQVGFSYKLAPLEPEPVATPLIVKGPAVATNDLPKPGGVALSSPPFVMNWSGFYAGAQIGYGWGDNDGSITYATPGGVAGQSGLSSSAIISGGGNNRNGEAEGVIGGAHFGYNRQFDKWVVGLEGSVDPTLMSRAPLINVPNTAADPTGALGVGATATGAIWSSIQGSVRARAGYALDRMLFYGTGGVAIGEFGSNFQVFGTDLTLAPFYAADQRSVTRLGWTAGAGVEYAVNPRWAVRGEYRYSDFGHLGDSPAPTSIGVVYAADRHLDQQQVQVGVSYKFGTDEPVSAKY